jgi:signal transduction histidine kinase
VKLPTGLRVWLTLSMAAIALLVSLIAIAVHTGLEVHNTVKRSAERTRAAAQQAAFLAGRAATEAAGDVTVLRSDRALVALFESALAGDPTLLDLTVVDPSRIAVAHSNPALIGQRVDDRPPLEALESGDVLAQTLRLLGAPRTYDEVVDLRAGNQPFGEVRVGVSTALLREQLIASLRVGLWVVGIAVLIAILMAVLSAQVITSRVRAVATGLERFREGQFGYRLAVEGQDELSLLASSINALGERLESARQRAAAGEADTGELLAATGHLSAWAKVASGLAHEMADPLQAAALHLGHLRRKWKEPPVEARRHIQVLEDELKRLEQIVLGFRRFVMLGEMHSQWFDLRSLLEEVATRARESAQGRRIEVVLEAGHAPSRFYGDASLLRQALSNLVSNGEQAMRGGGRLTIAARAAGEDALDLVVADEGVGMSPEVQARVFDLYFTTKSEGTGIGLAVVKQVAQLHGGRVELRSQPGEGTAITIHLPVRAPQLVSVA